MSEHSNAGDKVFKNVKTGTVILRSGDFKGTLYSLTVIATGQWKIFILVTAVIIAFLNYKQRPVCLSCTVIPQIPYLAIE